MTFSSDFEIIDRILAGNERAFIELVNRHKDRAMTLAVRLLKDHHEAEEILQDAFIRAFNALPKFQKKSSFSTWFYRIVYNQCVTALSRRGEKDVISVDEEMEDGASIQVRTDDPSPDVIIEQNELRQIVQREVEQMSPEYASILTLFLIQDLSYEEIVEVTGLPLGTVKNRLFRARSILREAVVKKLGVGKRFAM